MESVGLSMYQLCKKLFPICRCITGDGSQCSYCYKKSRLPYLLSVHLRFIIEAYAHGVLSVMFSDLDVFPESFNADTYSMSG